MKKFLSKYFPVIPLLLILGPVFFSHSCANTTQAPTGGLRDTLGPVLVGVSPKAYATNIPLTGQVFAFTFDEYVKVKTATNIYLSPPLKKAPKSKVRGKSVLVWFENDTLKANTTYTIDFTDALADNNEGNAFAGYTYVFSTGEAIDTMMITGIVQDCNTLTPTKGATVMLYKDISDSAIFKTGPDASAKTDDWGYFCIRNIQDTLYRLYAITDDNNDNIFNPESELVAFCDTLIRPHTVVNDSLPEVIKYDMKDTLKCQSRKTEFSLNLFKEKNAKQMLNNKVRIDDRTSYITFMAPNAHIDTMWMKGIPEDCLITQFNRQRDSLEIWVNDRRAMPDTFHLFVNYLKTDTLGGLSSFTEEVKLPHPIPATKRRSFRREVTHDDTTCVFKLNAQGERLEEEGFKMEFKLPIIYEGFDSLKFRTVNPKQQEEPGTFKVVPDSTDLKVYYIKPDVKYLPGYEYILKVPAGVFRDINGSVNDSTEVKASLPNDEKLSSLSLKLSGVHGKYIIDLLNEQKTTAVRSYVVTEDKTLTFQYLQAGKYYVRITEDLNDNSLVDTGCLIEHKQPEKVKFYKFNDEGDGNMLEIPEASELEQNVDIVELFK